MNRTFHDTDTSNYIPINRDNDNGEIFWGCLGFIVGVLFAIVTIILLNL